MTNLKNLFYSLNDCSFKLSCPSVHFVVAPHYFQIAFEGSGFVRCNKSGAFEYEFLVKASDRKWIQEINHCIPHSFPMEYFQLQLSDENGINWIGCEWVRPQIMNLDSAYKSEIFTIKGTISSLVTNSLDKCPEKSDEVYQFILPNAGRFPWQCAKVTTTSSDENKKKMMSRKLCYQVIEVKGIQVMLEQLDDTEHVNVTIKATDGQLPPFIDVKVLETIIFITGRIMNVGVQLREGKAQNCIRILAEHEHLLNRQFPPVNISEFKNEGDFWRAFSCFLIYLIDTDPLNPYFHPLMEILLPVMEAGSRAAGIYSLTLAVAIEAVVEKLFENKSQQEENYPNAEIDKLKEYIKINISEAKLKNRLYGAIANITSKKISVSGRLGELVDSNVISKKQLESWKYLRHTAVHGGFAKIPDKENFDELFGDVYTLINTLILREAKYAGAITDYGAIFSSELRD